MYSLSSEDKQLAEKVLYMRKEESSSEREIRRELGISEVRHAKIMKYLLNSGQLSRKENAEIIAHNVILGDAYTLERIYAARKIHRCSVDAVCMGLGISYRTYQDRIVHLVRYGLMTRKENDEINLENKVIDRMDFLEKVYAAKVSERMTNKDAMKTLGISTAKYDRAVKDLIRWGFVSKEEIASINRESHASRYSKMKERLGEEKAAEIYRNGWRKGYGKNTAENAVKGGLAVQKKAAHVISNLDKGTRYGAGAYRFRKAWFDSIGERRLAALLYHLGVLGEPVEGRNVQVAALPLNKKARLDMLVEFGGRKIDVEWHPIPRERLLFKHSAQSYYAGRKAMLEENGFEGDLLVLTRWGEVYPKLRQLGIVSSFGQYHEALIKTDKEIGSRRNKWAKKSFSPQTAENNGLEKVLDEIPF